MNEREKLIRAVQEVTWNASNYPEKMQPHVLGQDIVPLTMRIVDAVDAVFEKAHTPTDDEREALRIAELDARQAAYRQDRADWFVDHEQESGITTNAFFRGWDAAVDGDYRRTEVPERLRAELEAMTAEKEKWRIRCAEETIAWADEAAENRRLLTSEPHAEPSSEVPEPSGPVDQGPSLTDHIYALLDEMNEEGGRISYSDYCVLHGMVSQLAVAPEPQGEPSDARVLEGFLGKLAGDGAYTLDFSSAASLHDHIVRLLKRDIAALRAAGVVAQEGESRG